MIMSTLVVASIFVLFPSQCLSFVVPSSSTSSTLLSLHNVDQTKTQHGYLFQNNRRIIHSTRLFDQKKKPRFSQKGSHIAQGPSKRQGSGSNNKQSFSTPNNGRRKKRPPPMQNQPWASGKSIDDLESTMANRWGTLDDSSAGQIPEGFEFFDGDESDFEIVSDFGGDDGFQEEFLSAPKKNNKKKNESKSDRWRRPVLDPWDEEETRSKNGNKFTGEREYYDQDDEGFEILGEVDDDDNDDLFGFLEDESYVPRVDHLIAPKPAGGRGSNRNVDSSSQGGGYFFNPNAAANAAAAAKKKQEESQVSAKNGQKSDSVTSGAEGGNKNDGRRKKSASAKPLVDDVTGKPRLLTVDEAFNQFQESIDEGMMEVIETAEVPILAKKANSRSWDDLGITSSVVLENLQCDMNCPTPLAVQEKTTPAILTGNDVLVGTYTGSGKTLSFLVPLVQRLLWDVFDDLDVDDDGNMKNDPGLAVLIVAPGRELASQIVSVARDLLQDTGLKAQLAIGGTTFKRNLEQLRKRKPNIVVGTPGRIAELVVGKPGEK